MSSAKVMRKAMFILRASRKAFVRLVARISFTYKLLSGFAVLCLLSIASMLLVSDQPNPAALAAAPTKQMAVHKIAPVTPQPGTDSSGSAAATPAVPTTPKPSIRSTAPQLTQPPIDTDSLALSATSITVGPDQPASLTLTPSAGSMFYTIAVQAIVHISYDVSVIHNVTAPVTIHYSFPPSDPYNQPVAGTYDLTIIAQDHTKATRYYHFQLTVLPPVSDQ